MQFSLGATARVFPAKTPRDFAPRASLGYYFDYLEITNNYAFLLLLTRDPKSFAVTLNSGKFKA